MIPEFIYQEVEGCPYCKSDDIDYDDHDDGGDTYWHSVSCGTCGGRWAEVFDMTFSHLDLHSPPEAAEEVSEALAT